MAKTKKKIKSGTNANLGFEEKLWAAADALRNNMDAAELRVPYMHENVVGTGI